MRVKRWKTEEEEEGSLVDDFWVLCQWLTWMLVEKRRRNCSFSFDQNLLLSVKKQVKA